MILTCSIEHDLTESERMVVDYINANEAIISELTISQIAEHAYCSMSTVSRAIRKCGYASLAEMRVKLSSAAKAQDESLLVNEILAKSYVECTRTIENIQTSAILKIVEYIRQANRIFIISSGSTVLVAQELEFHLQCQRCSVWTISDSRMQSQMDRFAKEGDLVIIISVANSTPELAIAAERSKQQGANVVVCCCKPNTPLEQFADVFLLGYSQPIFPNHIYGGTSRLALQIFVRTIVEYMGI